MNTVFTSTALHTALTVGGAAVGGSLTKLPDRPKPFVFDGSEVPGALFGAVATPAAYHLVKPLISTVAKQGLPAAAAQAGPLLARGAVQMALFGTSGVMGAMVAANLAHKPEAGPFGGVAAVVAMVPGAMAGPVIFHSLRSSLGNSRGSACFAGLAAALIIGREAHRHCKSPTSRSDG